jgi:hypothetical protein
MSTRRTFLRASAAFLALGGATYATAQDGFRVFLPLTMRPLDPIAATPGAPSPTRATPLPTPDGPTPLPIPTTTPRPRPIPAPELDAPIVGPASGTFEQAVVWLASRADSSYSAAAVYEIVAAYERVGSAAGVDWFLAVAQMAHETGHLTSFWSLRPQRNPAGIGVTGHTAPGGPNDPPPAPTGWAFNTQRERWEAGVSFATWANDAAPAHLGRLLAYARTDADATAEQRALIAQALAVRSLPADLRGVAPRWVDLNGRWAAPGTTYGQSIINLARRMRGDPQLAETSLPLDALPSGAEDADWMPADG